MKNITVYTLVYNEEARIENLLRNCLWSDDIIVYDKSSTDKTRELASKYPCRVIKVPYYDAGAGLAKNIVNDAKNEWILALQCSDIIHPGLVNKILELINNPDFDYERIGFPSITSVFGIYDKKSPWSPNPLWMTGRNLFKKNVVVFTEVVHREIQFKTDKIYWLKPSSTEALFHLTHENLETFFERHNRYAKSESNLFETRQKGFLKCFFMIFVVAGWMIIKKRTLLLGWKGIFLFLAYLSYYINIFLYTYQKFEGRGEEDYKKIREKMAAEWDKWHANRLK